MKLLPTLIISSILLFQGYQAYNQSTTQYQDYVDSVMLSLESIETANEQVEKVVNLAIAEQNLERKLQLLHEIERKNLPADDTVIAKIWYEKSISHLGTGYLDSSKYFIDKLLETSTKYKNIKGQLSAYNLSAHIDSQKGEFENAINNYFKALEVVDQYGGEKKLQNKARILGNLSGVFFYLDDYESAKKYVSQELEIGRQLDAIENTSFALVRMGIMEEKLGNYKEAIKFCLQAEEQLSRGVYTDDILLSNCYSTLGAAYKGLEQWSNARSYLAKGISLCRKNEDLTNLFDLLKEQARIYIALGNTSKANQLVTEALELSRGSQSYGNLQSALEAKVDVEKAKQNFELALAVHEELDMLKDSTTNLEAKNRIAELQAEYENEKKEAEIERLSLESSLQQILIEKARLTLIFSIGGFLLLVGFIILYFIQRSKKLLVEKEAQEFQFEALKNRFMEIHSSPGELAFSLELDVLNKKLNTPLTEREFETLRLTIEGKTNAKIAEELIISVNTVKYHLRNVYSKMGVGNRKEAFRYILQSPDKQ
ncbi:MAG: tetratricopeptide repeat protein [Cyclobacteriaceae bacterium]